MSSHVLPVGGGAEKPGKFGLCHQRAGMPTAAGAPRPGSGLVLPLHCFVTDGLLLHLSLP